MGRVTVAELAERMEILEQLEDERGSNEQLEGRIAALETVIQRLGLAISGETKARKPRKKRVYTEEQRSAFRARMVAGKEAKAKREAEATEENDEE